MTNKILTQSTIHDPRLFISPVDGQTIQHVRSRTYRWKDQPFWKTQGIQFDHNARSRRRKLIEALLASDEPPLQSTGLSILNCSPHSRCRSPFCDFCRTKLQDTFQERVTQAFRQSASQDLVWLTLLDDITYSPLTDIPSQLRKRRTSLREFLKHHFPRQVRVFGAFEVDVKNNSVANDSDQVLQTLSAYGFDRRDEDAYMLHFHAVVDLCDTSRDAFRKTLKGTYSKPSQVAITSFHADKTKHQNLRNLSRYMTKVRYQYSDNILRAKPSYGSRFSDDTIRQFVDLIYQIKGSRGLASMEFRYNILSQ